MVNKNVRLIAFYLPQYHPVPENDLWWGKGFTEWVNVKKAQPLFHGHYQPHVPSDLGYYDLRNPEVRQSQADLARQHGIEGFCYWHYWFEGKRLLELPINENLVSGKPNLPFCLAWANETWSRRWLGEEKSILIKQTYSAEDDCKHIQWLFQAFSDSRYIRVNGRPIFLVYRPNDLPDPKRTNDVFREQCVKNGVPEPCLVGINSHCFGLDCRSLGFDETLNFMPQLGLLPDAMIDEATEAKRQRNRLLNIESAKLKLYDYENALDKMLSASQFSYPTYPTIFPGWDNSPRRGGNGIVLLNSTPQKFERALSRVVDDVLRKPFDDRLIFINAWNEWAEGNHIEPDQRHGRQYLEAISRIVVNERSGIRPGAQPDIFHRLTNIPNKIEDSQAPMGGDHDIRAIAFYLPQFHPIPENDEWWGKGFTEWTNVVKGDPQFKKHYQPHIPADLGYYDLRLAESREAQVSLAKEHGIHGFCYYHYWFEGRRLLNRPIDEVMSTGKPDFPFCLCWANENWTRAWDGGDNQILVEQKYSEQDDRDHIAFLCKIFRDSRYIRVNSKPLFIVYRASRLPDPLKTTTIWRDEAKRLGIGELYLCRVERFLEDMYDPRKLGFDAGIEFQPDGVNLGKPSSRPIYKDRCVYDYQDMVNASLSKRDPGYIRYPCVCPSWDNSARKKKNAVIFKNSTPFLYEKWLMQTTKKIRRDFNGEKFIFINAWNEWGEGCHLEPDLKFGRGFLEANRRALIESRSTGTEETAEGAYQKILQEFIIEGKEDKGIEAIEELLKKHPGLAIAYNDLGVLYYKRGDKNKARACYEKASFLDPDNSVILKNLAEFYFVEDGRTEDALRLYHHILSALPCDSETLFALGLICEKNDLINDAVDFYYKVLDSERDHVAARERLDALGRNNISPGAFPVEVTAVSNSPNVSIVIPVYNKLDYTKKCVEATIQNTNSVPYELIIVDNGSSDGTRDYLESLKDKIKIIGNQTNMGFARACNQGAAAAVAPYVLFLNNDTVPRGGWLEPLVNVLERDPTVAAVGSKLLFPDETIQHAGVLILDDRKLPDPLVARHIFYNRTSDFAEANRPKIYQALTAACFLIRKEAFDSVGGFDEEYWNGYEDIDLCFKLQKNKWLLVYHPSSVLTHHESKSGAERFTKVQENIERLHRKWIGKIEPDGVIEKDGSFRWSGAKRLRNYATEVLEIKKTSNHLSEKRVKTVSIVILTFNQLNYTKKCVESIRKHTSIPHEIVFVDNNSTDGTVKWLKKIVQRNVNYMLIENKKNLGFSKGCNQGIEASTGQYILLLNNDVVVTENWLAGMVECIKSAPDIGIVGPMTNNISGPQKVPIVDYTSIDGMAAYARAFREKNRYRRKPCKRVVGFCMLFKSQLAEEIGLLDESFGSGNFEDDDLCLRASLAGYRNFIAGDVFIHHYGSRTFIGNKIDYGSSLSRNKKVFAEKWSGKDVALRFGKRLLIENAITHAEEFCRKGANEKATASLIEAIKIVPEDKRLYLHLAEILIDGKQYDDALGILESVPGGDIDKRQLALLGCCEEGLGHNDKAQEYAAHALALDPSMALALNIAGVVAYKKGEKDTAEGLFKKAIDSDPGFGESYTNLGSLRWASGERIEALNLFERGFILSSTVADVVTAYHSAVAETGTFERAETVFRDARALHPNDKRIAFFIISVLIQQGKHDLAMREIEHAMIQFGIGDGILNAALEIRLKTGPLEIRPGSTRRSLSICMIVKNEELNLAKCLMSVKPVADEIIVIDTGSTDKTMAIAAALGAKVFDFAWKNSFSEARNYSLSKASGEWILVLDADEIISPLDHEKLKKLVKKAKKRVAYSMVTRNYTNQAGAKGWTANEGRYIQEEAGRGWFPSTKVRLFANDKRINFVNPVHELVEPALEKIGIKIQTCDVPVQHYGKLNQDKLILKGKEYYRLGIAKIEKAQGDYNALKELGIQAAEIGEYEEAVHIWQKVLDVKPQDPVAFMNMGYAHLMLEQYEKAKAFSKNALDLDPELREAALNYSASELIAGDVKTAISTLEYVLKKHPDYPPAFGRMAAACLVGGRKNDGVGYLDRLHAKGFNCASVLEEQARALHAQGKNEQAVILLEVALEKGMTNGRIHPLLAECRQKMKYSSCITQ